MQNSKHISNENIDIFPISAPRPDPAARVLNETNISGMIKGLTDFSSYVVSYAISNNKNLIEFYIQGYHCRADITEVLNQMSDQETSIYAILRLDVGSTPVISSSHVNFEEEDPFSGIVFNSSGTLTPLPGEYDIEYHSLLLLTRNSSNWEVPAPSRARFKGTAIDASDFIIDGGFEE